MGLTFAFAYSEGGRQVTSRDLSTAIGGGQVGKGASGWSAEVDRSSSTHAVLRGVSFMAFLG